MEHSKKGKKAEESQGKAESQQGKHQMPWFHVQHLGHTVSGGELQQIRAAPPYGTATCSTHGLSLRLALPLTGSFSLQASLMPSISNTAVFPRQRRLHIQFHRGPVQAVSQNSPILLHTALLTSHFFSSKS